MFSTDYNKLKKKNGFLYEAILIFKANPEIKMY